MASKASQPEAGRQQEVLEGLQKKGTLNRNTVVHISRAKNTEEVDLQSTRSSSEPIVSSIDTTSPSLEERIIILSDGTQIILESINELMLVGPLGARIVLSCLPLFLVPDFTSSPQHPKSLISSQSTSSSSRKNVGAWVKFSESIKVTEEIQLSGSLAPGSISDPLPSLSDVFGSSVNDDVFTYLDPFEDGQLSSQETFALEESSRDKVINDVFVEANEEKDCSDSDENIIEDEDDNNQISVNYVDDLTPLKNRTASVSFVAPQKITDTTDPIEKRYNTVVAPPTPLPSPPLTIFPRYEEKNGWLIKLSYRRGMFGDRWQKRYFILNGPTLSYFKKYGDSQPRGIIKLLPNSWCTPVTPGSPRMTDAVAKTARTSIMSVNRCLAVHRPNNFAASLSALLASEGVVEAFNSLTVALSNPEDSSRTFYMIAPSEQERHSWIDAIDHNIKAYARSPEALDVACKELQSMLQAVGCTVKDNMSSILLLLYTRRDLLTKKLEELCIVNNKR